MYLFFLGGRLTYLNPPPTCVSMRIQVCRQTDKQACRQTGYRRADEGETMRTLAESGKSGIKK